VTEEVVTRHKAQVATPAELAAAREARGMSQIDISHRIKLQIKQVNALEQGQWHALPGRSFVRGALRSYGRLLDVDVAPLLESIGGFAEPSLAPVLGSQPLDATLSRSSGLGFDGGGRGSPLVWVIACLAGVVGLVLYFGSDQDASRFRSWLPSGDTPSEVAADPAPADPAAAGVLSAGAAAVDPFSPGGQAAAGSAPGQPAGTSPLPALPRAPPLPARPQLARHRHRHRHRRRR
jgi:cytoskeleton protein RodZ